LSLQHYVLNLLQNMVIGTVTVNLFQQKNKIDESGFSDAKVPRLVYTAMGNSLGEKNKSFRTFVADRSFWRIERYRRRFYLSISSKRKSDCRKKFTRKRHT